MAASRQQVRCVLAQGVREHAVVYLSLLPVMGGVIINSGGEPLFHLLGFSLCMTATAGRAIKTVGRPRCCLGGK